MLLNHLNMNSCFLFYIFFEGILIPMFLIIGIWGCKYHDIITGHRQSIFCYPLKPSFDLVVDDKAKRIEEL